MKRACVQAANLISVSDDISANIATDASQSQNLSTKYEVLSFNSKFCYVVQYQVEMKSRSTIATGCLISIGVAAAGRLAVAEAEAERARRPPPRDRNLVRLPVRRRTAAKCQGTVQWIMTD